MDYDLVAEVPSVDDYMRLRQVSGLSAKSREGAAMGLPNSWHAVVVRLSGRAVGMGRIIGDGGTAFQIVDIAVEPEQQGRGLGKRIMQALMDELEVRAPDRSYVSLIADGEARHLYARFGFEPVMPKSIGMAIFLRRQGSSGRSLATEP